jgi:hypothetical protein
VSDVRMVETNKIYLTTGAARTREKFRTDIANSYSQWLSDPDFHFPPVVAFFDGETYWLADGFHRHHAYQQSCRPLIPCDVREGTERDAVRHALSANTDTRGIPRTPGDVKAAIRVALDDPEWGRLSDREIADLCAGGHSWVSDVRKHWEAINRERPEEGVPSVGGSLSGRNRDPSTEGGGKQEWEANGVGDNGKPKRRRKKPSGKKKKPRVVKTKHGGTTVMETARIGKSRAGRLPKLPEVKPRALESETARRQWLASLAVLFEQAGLDLHRELRLATGSPA